MESKAHRIHDLHGDLAFWLFAAAELITVGIGLIVFAIGQAAAPIEAAQLHDVLHRNLALANTLILLTSGAILVVAIDREYRGELARGLWGLALLVGSAFPVVKGYEFFAMTRDGFGLSSGTLVSGYFLLTGFHFLHVALGLVFIGSIYWQRCTTQKPSEEQRAFGASAGVFWHSLDLMWIAIFAVVYS